MSPDDQGQGRNAPLPGKGGKTTSTRGRGEVLGQAGVAEACAYTLEGVSKNQKKVRYKSPACAERTRFSVLGNGNSAARSPCVRSAHEGDL